MFGSPPDDGKREIRSSIRLLIIVFPSGKEASWERVLITFQKYAIDFKKRYGCVPVLIFDNCDALAAKDEKMLETLQDTAKVAIDDSTWVTIFIGSIGKSTEQMEGLFYY